MREHIEKILVQPSQSIVPTELAWVKGLFLRTRVQSACDDLTAQISSGR
jgi:hypothetical protein